MKLLTKTLIISALLAANVAAASDEPIQAQKVELAVIQQEAKNYIATHLTTISMNDVFAVKHLNLVTHKDSSIRFEQPTDDTNNVIAD